MTEVRVERYRNDGDRRGATSVTFVVQVPPGIERDAVVRDLLERAYDHVAAPAGDGFHPDVSDSAAREDEDMAAAKARAAERLHAIGCRCPERPYCVPHVFFERGCEAHDHVFASWIQKAPPVEPDDLERDRAEQLVAALATALRAERDRLGIEFIVMAPDDMARRLLAHPYVRDALEPARAMVLAEPLGEIVSFRYREDSGRYGKATHVIVRLEKGVTVSAGTLGKQVGVLGG